MSKPSRTKSLIVIVFVAIVAVSLLLGRNGRAAAHAGGLPPATPEPSTQGADKTKQKGGPVVDYTKRTKAEAAAQTAGCITCHSYNTKLDANGAPVDSLTMHTTDISSQIGCADCHGGDASIKKGDLPDNAAADKAHGAKPSFPERWSINGKRTTRNPEKTATLLNKENIAWIQFINPGDLRVAQKTCGGCHADEVNYVQTSMMRHGAMLWEAALYNNGGFFSKVPFFGEGYNDAGEPERLETNPAPSAQDQQKKGVLPYLQPLPRWEISTPGNVLRVFERGEDRLSARGFGTNNRTDPVFLGLQKTRLLDPTLNFLGTNDHPGDYRSSGCTACHTIYANDRSETNSGPFANFTNMGYSQSSDPTIPKDESGHPIKHVFARSAIPSSQCIVCHIHPGTNMVSPYLGYTWWDNETDAEAASMYPAKQPNLSAEKIESIQNDNPEGSAVRGKWGQDKNFLANVTDVNDKLKHTQFADFHGHGWIYRAVFKQNRHGALLNAKGQPIQPVDDKGYPTADVNVDQLKKAMDPKTAGGDDTAVHMKDIHLEKGMQCVDCHFNQDAHGNGKLYGEVRAAIEIDCIDCHGSVQQKASLTAATHGPAGGVNKLRDFKVSQAPGRPSRPRFYLKSGKLFQRSALDPKLEWEVMQTKDTVDPDPKATYGGKPAYNEKSAYAKTLMKGANTVWADKDNKAALDKIGDISKVKDDQLAHGNSSMTCYACHTSWTTSCFGCHLPMQANKRRANLHNEGSDSKNWTQYNFQTLRDDVYMLGHDSTVTGHRVVPVRSSCAILVGSQSLNREWFYSQQQTVSAEGYAGTAFSAFVPHTVRSTETKGCSDCHVSSANNNNAQMAQLLMQGTNFYNFIGRFAYIAAGKGGIEAVEVTEQDEPQAVYGSDLHKVAYPEDYKRFVDKEHKELKSAFEHHANGEALSIQARGEYAYVANGPGGMRVYDIARVDDKLFSERISTSQVSPLGQRTYIKSKFATAVASPSTLAVDPTRKHFPQNEEAENRDDHQPIHPLYAYLYITDRDEGLIMTNVATLLDGNPNNNFLYRAKIKQPDGSVKEAWNPDGVLTGATNIMTAGNYAYISAKAGLVVVDLSKTSVAAPNELRVVKVLSELKNPRAVAVQFRYAFVVDEDGLKVVDITNPENPSVVPNAFAPIPGGEAHNIYIVRNNAFVAAGKSGVKVFDIETPTIPREFMTINADGQINDAHDVKVGITNNSLFAYIADGKNGLRIVQLASPDDTPGIYGFSPRLSPKLIATHKTHEPVLAVSEGLDRDRAVDESGNQLAVFGRRGARPFNLEEMQRLYMRDGKVYTVSDTPTKQTASTGKSRGGSIASWFGLMSILLPLGLMLRPRRRKSD